MGNYRTGTSNYRGGIKSYFSKQASDLTVNNSEVYVDTDMVTPTLTIGKSYVVNAYFLVNSGTTPDYKFKNVVTTMVATYSSWDMSSTGVPIPTTAIATEDAGQAGTGANKLYVYIALLLNVTTAGTFKLQFAQNTATVADTKFLKGSYWIIKEI